MGCKPGERTANSSVAESRNLQNRRDEDFRASLLINNIFTFHLLKKVKMSFHHFFTCSLFPISFQETHFHFQLSIIRAE